MSTEIRIQINSEFLEDLRSATGVTSNAELINDSLTLLSWVVNKIKDGESLILSDETGLNLRRVSMPILDRIQKD